MNVSERSVAIFYQGSMGLGILYSQQFIAELTDSSAALSVTCQNVDVERLKMLFQTSLKGDRIVEAACFHLHHLSGRVELPFSLPLLSLF